MKKLLVTGLTLLTLSSFCTGYLKIKAKPHVEEKIELKDEAATAMKFGKFRLSPAEEAAKDLNSKKARLSPAEEAARDLKSKKSPLSPAEEARRDSISN